MSSLKLSFVIEALDRATAPIRAINRNNPTSSKRIAAHCHNK